MRPKFNKKWVHNDLFYVITWGVALVCAGAGTLCFAQWGALQADKIYYKQRADYWLGTAALLEDLYEEQTYEYNTLVSGQRYTNFDKNMQIHKLEMKYQA